jgi:carboxypeptidase family protein/TonB-dependent receptor-like protein
VRAIALIIVLSCPALASAQAPLDATLRITIVDPSGGVIVGARVDVAPIAGGAATSLETGGRGDVEFAALTPGRYSVHVEAPGFEPRDVRDLRLRNGETRREIKLDIAKLAERVDVGRDARERGSDPRSDAFATVLGQAEINELPDDPDEMERVLREMAGPGAVMRVNGFRGGKLPPKDQIAQIRFHRNMFAADSHEPGMISVDIVTKPGMDNWRGSTSLGLRSDVLNARNAFAPTKGEERNERIGVSLSGPLRRQHTSLSFSVDGVDAFDTRTIVAALPSGFFADSIRKPTDTLNFSARAEHALTPAQQLRIEAQRNHTFNDNLGVGDFDLAERAFRQTRNEEIVRVSLAGSIRKSLFNDLRFQFRHQDASFASATDAAAVLVLNAFNRGGAQIAGGRGSTDVEVADDLDISTGRHALRAGFLLEAGRYGSDERRNAAGTFTFADLAAYAAGRPTTYTRNVGDPNVTISQAQAGVYFQDDYRARKELTLSAGVRGELQSHIGGFHLGPRAGLAWSPLKSGKTTVRAGGGVFFDWFDALNYEQAVQLDGTHQQIETIVQPGYPNPLAAGSALLLPNGRIRLGADLGQPHLFETSAGVEQLLPGGSRLNLMYIRRRGSSELRGVNVNAPAATGVRPDSTAGTITEIQSTASSAMDGVSVNFNYMNPQRRFFVAANYMLARSINETDSPFSVAASATNLGDERGPALQDARHRFMSFANFPLFKRRLTVGSSIRVQSALPYNITTGRDDNGDTISNDRPAGVTRNSGRGRALVDLSTRLSWRLGFGGAAPAGPGGPQIRLLRGGGDSNPLGDMPTGDGSKRYAVELYAQAFNLLNRVNATTFSGVVSSPFFGQATAAAPPRRVEVGARLSF